MSEKMKRVCLIGTSPSSRGGVAESMLYLALIYKMLGYNVVWVETRRTSFSTLRICDIIHVHGLSLRLKAFWLILLRKPRKLLTLHGFILDEVRTSLYFSHGVLGTFKALIEYINISIHWIVHKLILIQLIYDYVTAVSYVKARKNHVRAIVIPNPIICRSSGSPETPLLLHPDEVLFITYVSPGVRITNLPKLVKVVYLVNKNLERLGVKKHVVLHVYGDVPPALLKTLSRYPFVKFMGYVSDFIKRLSVADIFLDGFPSAELGHTALESICVGVPVAKFTEDPSLEEVVDGFSGILAISDEEMVEKLTRYVLNMDEMKKMFVRNARNITQKRDLRRIAIMWRTIIGKC